MNHMSTSISSLLGGRRHRTAVPTTLATDLGPVREKICGDDGLGNADEDAQYKYPE